MLLAAAGNWCNSRNAWSSSPDHGVPPLVGAIANLKFFRTKSWSRGTVLRPGSALSILFLKLLRKEKISCTRFAASRRLVYPLYPNSLGRTDESGRCQRSTTRPGRDIHIFLLLLFFTFALGPIATSAIAATDKIANFSEALAARQIKAVAAIAARIAITPLLDMRTSPWRCIPAVRHSTEIHALAQDKQPGKSAMDPDCAIAKRRTT